LFDGQLAKLKVPVTFMHGRQDPRTEPGEIERAGAMLPEADLRFVEAGRHSPHSESKSWQRCNEILSELFSQKYFAPSPSPCWPPPGPGSRSGLAF
jgi:pimeloyl-ACP methyl ester carboxylesterase